jgi:hypothetical protein
MVSKSRTAKRPLSNGRLRVEIHEEQRLSRLAVDRRVYAFPTFILIARMVAA